MFTSFDLIMAGHLLLVLVLCSSHVIKAGALPPPKLTVNPLVITETDSVTLSCVTPSSVSVTECHFFIAKQEISKNLCVETLTGTDVLKMAYTRSPVEVEVRCFYTEQSGVFNSASPDSESSTIIINNLLQPKLTVNPLVITETDSVTLNCQLPPSVSVSECYFYISRKKPATAFSCLKKLTGTELLSLARQSSPATVEVTCFYLMSHQSPDSTMSAVTIHIPRPELRVNPLVITETDLVTVNCVTPPSVSVTECHLYSLTTRAFRVISCLQTLTGTELQSMAHHSSPAAEVEVTCFYTTGQYQSLHSNKSSIRIQKSTTTQMMLTSRMTTGSTTSTPADPVSSLSTSVTSVIPASETVSAETDKTTTGTLTSDLPSVTPTNSSPGSETDTRSWSWFSSEQWTLLVSPPSFGVTVGVIILGVTLVCHKRRSGKHFPKRSQANISGDFLSMTNTDGGGLLPAGNVEAYNLISFVPAADRPTGFEQVTRQESQNENSTVYHLYATISEDPPEAALKNMTYSTVQAH